MKKGWRTIFFLFGLAAVVLMLLTFDADWNRVKEVLSDAGIWFPVIVLQESAVRKGFPVNGFRLCVELRHPAGTYGWRTVPHS